MARDVDARVTWLPSAEIPDYIPFRSIDVDRDGFRENGLPGWIYISANVAAENVGYADGYLGCHFDREATRFPEVFDKEFVVVDRRTARGFEGPERCVHAGARLDRLSFCLAVRIAEQDPYDFAKAFGSLGSYRIRLRYYTQPLLGDVVLSQGILDIEGDFSEFREHVLRHWKSVSKYRRLAAMAQIETDSC